MTPMLAIALKDLRLLMRDPMALFWALIFPVVFAVFLGSILEAALTGKPREMDVVVVDDSDGEASRALVDALEGIEGIRITREARGDAEALVRSGERLAVFRVPGDFGDHGAQPVLVVDPSRSSEVAVLEAVLGDAIRAADARSQRRDAPPPPILKKAVDRRADEPAKSVGGFALVFPAAVLWGLMGCASSFATSLVSERTRGTLVRLRASPASLGAVLGGKAIACFVSCLTASLLMTAVAALVLGIAIHAPGLLLLGLVAASVCFSGLTMLMGSLGKSEHATAGAGWSVLLVMAMAGGAMVPLAFMPTWLASLGEASPVRWGIVALEAATWRLGTLHDLARVCAALTATGLLAFAVAAVRLRRAT